MIWSLLLLYQVGHCHNVAHGHERHDTINVSIISGKRVDRHHRYPNRTLYSGYMSHQVWYDMYQCVCWFLPVDKLVYIWKRLSTNKRGFVMSCHVLSCDASSHNGNGGSANIFVRLLIVAEDYLRIARRLFAVSIQSAEYCLYSLPCLLYTSPSPRD